MNMDIIFAIESFEVFESVLQEIVNNLYCLENVTTTHIEPGAIKAAKNDMKNIVSNGSFDLHKIAETLLNKDWDHDKIKYLLDLLNNKKSQLLQASLDHYNSSYGETITDFDWLLKFVFGTSELNTIQYPLLQLVLTIQSNGTYKKNMLDINKDALLKIINKLEKYVNCEVHY